MKPVGFQSGAQLTETRQIWVINLQTFLQLGLKV